ncbi:MAG: alkaline shock response membrane anchor protein AmaP [Clostridia bacterium]|nr:alkaline shock response membrane anchor protein AmaP [Clostridia bacterium]
MKILDAFISFVFSIVILVLSIAVILVLTGFTSESFIVDLINDYLFNDTYQNVALITSIVLALAALKTTIFHSRFKSKDTSPILVATENGNVQIAQETITNTVKSVALKIPNIKDVNAKMLKKKKGIKIFANISVLANCNIKQVTEELQSKVIEVIRETTGVKVLDVDVKVKNIYEKGQKAENKIIDTSKKAEEPAEIENKEVVAQEITEEKVETKTEELEDSKEEKKEE